MLKFHPFNIRFDDKKKKKERKTKIILSFPHPRVFHTPSTPRNMSNVERERERRRDVPFSLDSSTIFPDFSGRLVEGHFAVVGHLMDLSGHVLGDSGLHEPANPPATVFSIRRGGQATTLL